MICGTLCLLLFYGLRGFGVIVVLLWFLVALRRGGLVVRGLLWFGAVLRFLALVVACSFYVMLAFVLLVGW